MLLNHSCWIHSRFTSKVINWGREQERKLLSSLMFRTFTQELGLLASCSNEYVITYITQPGAMSEGPAYTTNAPSFPIHVCVHTHSFHTVRYSGWNLWSRRCMFTPIWAELTAKPVFPSANKCSNHQATQKRRVLLPALLFLQQLCESCSSLFFYVRLNRIVLKTQPLPENPQGNVDGFISGI